MNNFLESIGRAARTIVAMIVVLGGFLFLFFLLYKKIPVENKDILQIAAGIVLATMGVVTGYYFGSSKNLTDKDRAAQSLEEKKLQVNPDDK
jgi:phosphotransferase system  glucose/maltose/N-acetylglucosamine-specific IIC component